MGFLLYPPTGGGGGSLPAHPRVWMTPTRVTFLQTQRTNNTTLWQQIKAAADAAVADPTMAGANTWASGPHCGLAALACQVADPTSATTYGQMGASIATHLLYDTYSTTLASLATDSGYAWRSNAILCAYSYDWNYQWMTTTQRHRCAAGMLDLCDSVWPETNSARTGAWGVTDFADNYFWGFMSTFPMALAASGDDTGAVDIYSPGSGADRAATHIALGLSKWATFAADIVQPVALVGAGGGWSEGTGYGAMDGLMVGRFADAALTTAMPIDNAWFEAAIRYLMHTTTPDFGHKVPWGDQAAVSTGDLGTIDRTGVLDLIAPAKIDGTLTAQVYRWLAKIGNVSSSEKFGWQIMADQFRTFDPSVSAASDLSGMALSYLTSGVGGFLTRSSWTDANATLLAHRCGILWESHSGKDANSLRTWKGAFWVSCDANIYSASGIAQTPHITNTMVAGGTEQSGGTAPTIVQRTCTGSVVASTGQAASTYPGSIVTDFKRTVAYLPTKDTTLVVDDVTTASGSTAKVFRWHCKSDPTASISGMTFTLSSTDTTYKAYSQVFLQASAVIAAEAQNPDGGGTTSWAIKVTLPTGTTHQVTLTVKQLSSGGSAPNAITSVSNDGTNVYATVGGLVVTIPLDGTSTVTAV
jgi:hypothetical protein